MNTQIQTSVETPRDLSSTLDNLSKIAEYVLCANNPSYFLKKYAKIKSTEGKFIPFNLYSYQEDLLKVLLDNHLVVILKNRQVGCTWVVAGYAIWHAIFRKAANVILVSKDESAAGEVLDYCRFMYNNLPQFLKPEIDRNQRSLIEFTALGSKIRALPATSASGVGFGSASLIILDEFEFHPKDEENFVEIKPMIDAGGNRQLVILSAPNRLRLNSQFKTIWRDAKKNKNNFFSFLIPFGSVPHQTDEWYEKMKKEYTLRDLETRYFKTEQEAMSTTLAGKFFDADKLQMMTERIISPLVKYQGLDTRNGVIRIYKPPIPTARYCAFVDPSEGREDPFHAVILDIQTKEEVANAHGWMSSDEVAFIFDSLCRHYNNASNSFYRSGYTGARFAIALENLHTPNQMFARNPDGKERIGTYGYWESQTLKQQMLGFLRDGVFGLEYLIHDGETIDEFNLLMWDEDAKKHMVPDREHDDRITAWAGLIDILRRIPHGTINLVTYVPSKSGYQKYERGNRWK